MGSNNNPMDAHPRFGFTEKRIIDQALTNAAPTGTSVSRTAGLRYAFAMGIFTLAGGAGEVGLVIEGSNDGVNWFVLGQTAPTELFDTNGQVVILNDVGGRQVDLQHFDRVRARSYIASGAPVYSLSVIVTGIARDSEKFERLGEFGPRLGVAPTVQNSADIIRPAGTLLVNCQVTAAGVVLGGLASFDAVLQGSPDGGETWVDIGVAPVTAAGSQLMAVDTETFFSLGSLVTLRFQVRDNGVAGVATAFTSIDFFLTLDSCDWVIDDEAGGNPFNPSEVFVSVQFGAPGAEVLNVIPISLQVFDADGSPLNEVRKLELILYDTSQAGDLDLALNATFSAVTTGTDIIGLATNRLVVETDAAGLATVEVTDLAVESVYITAVNPRGPQAVPQTIVQAPEAELVFI